MNPCSIPAETWGAGRFLRASPRVVQRIATLARPKIVQLAVAAAVLLAFTLMATAQQAQYAVKWFTVDGGGGASSGGSYSAIATSGQPDAGVLSNAQYTAIGGFWGVQGLISNSPAALVISGRVTDTNGLAVADTTLFLVGTDAGSMKSAADGRYTFSNLTAGLSYRVIPYKNGFSFSPAQISLTSLMQDGRADFVAQSSLVPPVTIVQAQQPSGIDLRLDRVFYAAGQMVSARLDLAGFVPGPDQLGIILSAPSSGDMEVLHLAPAGGGSYTTVSPVSVVEFISTSAVGVFDRQLTLQPNEMFVAMWYVKIPVGQPQPSETLVSDFGLREDAAFTGSPIQMLPALALTDDERVVPPGGKPIGTLLTQGGLPVQIPVNELVIFPKDQAQLNRFLQDSGGTVRFSDALPGESDAPSAYLVRVDPPALNAAQLRQMRALLGETEPLYASSESVLRLYALGLRLQLDGYRVAVNPRLQYMNVPSISSAETNNVFRNMTLVEPLNIPKLWAFLALWDMDTNRIPVAFLDMGFAPNFDFRTPLGGLVECDMGGFESIGFLRCGTGTAVGPPTVGNSLFGGSSWHGNGVVTTAGGVVNNGWGSAGTGGQVVEPALYRFALASYAFEIGLGIRRAVVDEATVINVSASYPCRFQTTLGIEPNICTSDGRRDICGAATVVLATAAASVCAAGLLIDIFLPGVGATACSAATTVAIAASAACFAVLPGLDVRGPMESAIAFATERGVPVVTVAGNALSPTILPDVLRDIVNLTERRTETWEIIPAMIPQTIVAGAANDNWPFANEEFFGDRVDLWAPVRSSYMAPTNTTEVMTSERQALDSIGGTSAAAPYVAGVIAAMQAVNPALNPRTAGLSDAQRRAIPATIKSLLRSSAWTSEQLVDLAPPEHRLATGVASVERRNLINPFRAIEASVPPGSLPIRARSLGYSDALDFDETSDAAAADSPADARELTFGAVQTGSIVAIRGEGSAPTLADVDWFRYQVPSSPEGIFQPRIQLRVPRGFGHLFPASDGYTIAERAGTADEADFLITGPRLFAGSSAAFMLHGVAGSDNVYKLDLLPPMWSAAPGPDRFDRNDPRVNPPESRPNNNSASNGVPLGESIGFPELEWRLVASGPGGNVHEITISNLNFHTSTDEDWFEIRRFPNVPVADAPGCQPELEIHFSPGMLLDATLADGTIMVARQRSVVRIPWRAMSTRLRLHLFPESAGGAASYDLRLRLLSANDHFCALGSMHALIDEAMIGRGFFRFPRFLPELGGFDPSRFPGLPPRVTDLAGRITTPDNYLISWNGNGSFRASFEMVAGYSLLLRLRNGQGQAVAFAATSDLLQNLTGLFMARDAAGRAAQGGNEPSPLPGGRPLLMLVADNLPAGDYLLEVSHARLGTEILVTLPAGATTDGSASLETLVAGPLPESPALHSALGPAGLTLSWEVPAREFVLESTVALTSGPWTPVTQEPTTASGRRTVTVVPAQGQRYFRLRWSE